MPNFRLPWIYEHLESEERANLAANPVSATVAEKTPEYKVVRPPLVREYIIGLFNDPEIIASANVKGSVLNNIIEQLEDRPLFYFSGNKASRLNFSSWYGVLDVRDDTYASDQTIIRDLYLIHELNHLATMPYKSMEDEEWRVEHIKNEKASSVWSEAVVYFEYPALYEKVKGIFPNLWVTPYLEDKIQLIPGTSNKELYKKSPMVCSALLFEHFVNISEKDYASLSEAEKRTRNYDFMTEVWCDGNAGLQDQINEQQIEFRRLILQGKMEQAIQMQLTWLQKNTSPKGVLFHQELMDTRKFFQAARTDPRFATRQLRDRIPCTLGMQGFLQGNVKRMRDAIERKELKMTPLVEPTTSLLRNFGVTATIYSLSTLMAERTTLKAWGEQERGYAKLYGQAQARPQDPQNEKFTAAYKQWAINLITGLDDFKFAYPTSGSSEAIRESFFSLRADAKAKGKDIKLHIFQAEYEGAKNFAEGTIEVVAHPKRDLLELAKSADLVPGDLFYISYPSGIEGNRWDKLPEFLDLMQQKGVRVLLDFTYVGTYKPLEGEKVMANHPAIECVYFSLSKAFGVYYQRIGGIFARKENHLLFPNIWFKNMLSLQIGINLLENYPLTKVPDVYKNMQSALTDLLNAKLKMEYPRLDFLHLQPSDVFLMSHQKLSKAQYEKLGEFAPDLKILCRSYNNGNDYVLRACLQPMLDYLTNSYANTFKVFDLGVDLKGYAPAPGRRRPGVL